MIEAAESLVRTLGWTLLHSLWQGGLVVLFAAWALRVGQRRSAEFRYRLALGALVTLVAGWVATAVWISREAPTLLGGEAMLVAPGAVGPEFRGWVTRVRAALGPWIPWFSLIWMIGFLLRAIQLGRALTWLYGPCLRDLEPAPPDWQARFGRLQHRCGLRKRVQLGVSSRVDSLLVLGWLKPVVLVPAAALLALPPEALEALLAHELAHVRRGDFLANLLQSFAEALLFYHPAVWWLSRRIRLEREHCCDDAAVHACGDRHLYASALAGLEELRIQPMSLSDLAPAARGGSLMNRIRRILHPRLPEVAPAPLAAILPALLLAILGVAALRAAEAPAPAPPPVEVAFSKVRVKHQPPAPAYPPEAKEARIQGTVVVSLTVGSDGRVVEARALSGPPELQPCAVDYAKAWEFHPVQVKGKAVPARFKLTMPFRLR